MKKIFTLFLFLSCSLLFGKDFEFIHFEDNLINDVIKNGNEVYLYSFSEGIIYNFNINSEFNKPEVLYDDELNSAGINKFKDWTFWNGNLIAVGGNKVVNITDNFKVYSVKDEYNNEKSNEVNSKYREFKTVCVDSANNLVVSSGANTVKKVDNNGIIYLDSFSEIYRVNTDFKFDRVLKGELNSSKNYKNPVCSKDGDIFYIYNQKEKGVGGLIKIDKNDNINEYALKSFNEYSPLSPIFSELINNKLAIGYKPKKSSGYKLEGVSYFDLKNETWEHDENYLNFAESIDDILGFTARGIEKINDKLKIYYGGGNSVNGIILEIGNTFKLVDLNKWLQENLDITSYGLVLDVFKVESNNSFIVVHQNGIFKLPDDIITSIESDNEYRNISAYPNPTNGKVNIDLEGIKSVSVYNLQMQEVKAINSIGTNTIDITELPAGVYFLEVEDVNGDVYFEKVIKR